VKILISLREGKDEGPPGSRVEGKCYMAYSRDLDGNKISLLNKI
tara:strand:- start:3785 stop:3916 length:132 start_codon:yes stop_codon:yes gene_type:complete